MDITTVPISTLPRERMQAFYRQVFPRRSDVFFEGYEWRYRLGFDPLIQPVIAVAADGSIVGQAAMIPIRMYVDGVVHPASWFIDFMVMPGLQRHGVGQVLTSALMALCDTHLGQPNERSIGVLLKRGWQQQFGGYRFAYPIDVSAVMRYRGTDRRLVACASAVQPAYRLWKRAVAFRGAAPLDPQPLRAVAAELTEIVRDDIAFSLVHDHSWLTWRLLDSPFASQHFHASEDDAHVILRVVDSGGLRRAHILYLSDYASEASVRTLMRRLLSWSFESRIDLLWAVCSHPMLVRVLGQVFPSQLPQGFTYHAVGDARRPLEQRVLSMHAMDSDADIVYGDDTSHPASPR